MSKNVKLTPKVRETISGTRVAVAIDELTSYLLDKFDFSSPDTVLVGIQTRGVILAERLAQTIKKKKNVDVQSGALDITLYRDDYSTSGIQPIVGETKLNFDLDEKNIILVDDVLFTGRTIRAALDELMDFGRPKNITLVVLIDRGHRELPIQADFSAMTLSTKRDESVNLHLKESDNEDKIIVCEPIDD